MHCMTSMTQQKRAQYRTREVDTCVTEREGRTQLVMCFRYREEHKSEVMCSKPTKGKYNRSASGRKQLLCQRKEKKNIF